ncbi:hypothetical protein N752_21240 [Desulforamulus aquiferis]|nr:hypothetical protein N752_21240 [Desulforamulus aquiferis]
MIACPFNIPKYEWDKAFPLVTKCQMCSTKVERGESPLVFQFAPPEYLPLEIGIKSLLRLSQPLLRTAGTLKRFMEKKKLVVHPGYIFPTFPLNS